MSKLSLREVTPSNWRVDIKLKEEQKYQVLGFNQMLARAYAYRNQNSQVYLIYLNDILDLEEHGSVYQKESLGYIPIGAAMYYELPDDNAYNLCQFFIDERYQGNGYGKRACRLLLDKMRENGKYSKVILSYLDGNEPAKNMYLSLGFLHTGEADEDEISMSMDLS